MSFKEINPLWRLSDPLTVEQAAALIAGFDPNSVAPGGDYFKNIETGLTDSDGISLVQTAFSGLVNSINAGKLPATLRYDAEPRYMAGVDNLHERGYWGGEDVVEVEDKDGSSFVVTPVPNWSKSTVSRAAIAEWLKASGIGGDFFFPTATDSPDYLDPKNPRYAPKLAAAVRAWQSVTDAGGKHPKQALAKWLKEHAAEFGMTDDEGMPNKTGIEEAAKVANWRPGGGAPKTPG